jgi:N-acetylmuramic acid 6-phosphate etherase
MDVPGCGTRESRHAECGIVHGGCALFVRQRSAGIRRIACTRYALRMILPPDRAHVATEKRNPRTMRLHAMSIGEIVEIINREDRRAVEAVGRVRHRLSRLIEAMAPGFVAGGRIVYVGAGTSGRLGVLDASEAPPTFCVPPGRVIGIIAGGGAALRQSSEGAEDDPRGSWAELDALNLDRRDAVVAIAAGGTTAYTLGALAYCQERETGRRPLSALLTCAEPPEGVWADHVIVLRTGAEVLTGSTRMKAGTATKLVLNTISTTLMVCEGRVYENLMVDVRATNAKLRDRAARIVATLTGLSRDDCFELLERAGGAVKTAVVMARRGCTREHAERILEQSRWRLDAALGEPPPAPA